MTENEQNRFISIRAQLEGQAVIAAKLGEKIKISQMELVCLCNFAWLGVTQTLFLEVSGDDCDGDKGLLNICSLEEARKEIYLMIESIREQFGNDAGDGLNRLAQTTTGLLHSEKFAKYLVPLKGEKP